MFLASLAISKGFKLKYSEGLVKDEKVIAGYTEDSVFEALGLLCPKPAERENSKRKTHLAKNLINLFP